MKQIIKGKLYNTDSAKLVACAYSDADCTSFTFWSEDLYLKKTGEYFLHGSGGPMSKYAVTISDNEWNGGAKIIPMSYEAARKWAEENLSGEKYIELFGELSESEDGNEIMTISVPSGIAKKIRTEAQQAGKTISGTIAGKFD